MSDLGCSSSRVPSVAHVFDVNYQASTLDINGYVGTVMYGYAPTGSFGGATFTATGMPAWLTLNTSDGSFSGTPTAAGSGEFTITVSNGTCSKNIIIHWTVENNNLTCCDPNAFYIYQSGKPFPLQLSEDGYYYADVCKNDNVTFSVVSLAPGCNYTYKWRLASSSGGLLSEITNTTFQYTYDRTAGYNLSLMATKTGGGGACNVAFPIRIRVAGVFQVATRPSFDLCKGEPFNIYVSSDGIGSVDVVRPGGGSASTLGVTDTVLIPDGEPCNGRCFFKSSVTFGDFTDDAVIRDANDLLYISASLEHTFIGDIYIALVCPDGHRAVILPQCGSGSATCHDSIPSGYNSWPADPSNHSIDFGEPNSSNSSDCDPTVSGNAPGVGWTYIWSNNTTRGYTYAGGTYGYIYETANVGNDRASTVDSSHFDDMSQIYHPYESFNNLIGCPLNGTWWIEIVDGWGGDNGHIFHWELGLNEELIPDSWTYSVDIDSSWVTCGWSTTKAGVYMEITPPDDFIGTSSCDLSIRDEYGCVSTYENIVTVTMSPTLGHTSKVDNVCDAYTWDRTGQTYMESDTIVDLQLTEHGCPDRDTLILELNYKQYDTIDQQACQHYVWPINGHDYTTNTTATEILSGGTVAGCDSIVTLNLEILPELTTVKDTAVCPIAYPFDWYGSHFTGPGTKTQELHTTDGCDSTVTLTVTTLSKPEVTLGGVVDWQCPITGNYEITATITANTGTAPYVYEWTGAYTGNEPTATIASNGTCQSYNEQLIIIDANGCRDTAILAFSSVDSDYPTFGNTALVANPTVPATLGHDCTYHVPDLMTLLEPHDNCEIDTVMQSVEVDAAITVTTSVTVTVKDKCGNTTTQPISVTVPDALTATISKTDVACNGGNDGTVTLSGITGGTPDYTYSWTSSGGTATEVADQHGTGLTGVTAGTYTVVITDQNNCTDTLSATVEQKEPLMAVIDSTKDLKCYKDNSGAIYTTVTGGVDDQPYTYSWTYNGSSSPLSTGDIENLSAGEYRLIVKDANGCADTVGATIVEPDTLAVVVDSIKNLLCYNDHTGAVYVSVTGGTMAYTCTWSNGMHEADSIVGLTAGAYHLDVVDAHGCTAEADATVTQPDTLIVTINTPSWADHCPFANGNQYPLSIVVSGGTKDYNYQWNATWPDNHVGTGTDSLFSIMSDGQCHEFTVTIEVTDRNGCVATDDKVFEVKDAEPVVVNPPPSQELNYIGPGCEYVVPDLESIFRGIVTDVCKPDVIITQSPAAGSIETGALTAHVTIQDMCNTLDFPVELTVHQAIDFTFYSIGVTCYGDTNGRIYVLEAQGGTPPYSYTYRVGDSVVTGTPYAVGDTNAVFMNLPASDFYELTVTDANGCTRKRDADVATPNRMEASVEKENVKCKDGTDGGVQIIVTDGAGKPYHNINNEPFYYYVFGSDTIKDGMFDGSFPGLSAGADSVTVIDSNGCKVVKTFEIEEPEKLVVTIADSSNLRCNGDGSGMVVLHVEGGTAPYGYSWKDGNGDNVASDENGNLDSVAAGTYTVEVNDQNGCTATISVTLTEPAKLTATANGKDLDCKNDGTGAITLDVHGGTPYQGNIYTYLWSNGETEQNISNLQAGIYSVTITDSNGCQLVVQDTVNEPDNGLTIDSISADIEMCKQDYAQNISFGVYEVSGGTPGPGNTYSYTWSNGSTNALQSITINNSTPTNSEYVVTVKDNNDCTIRDTVRITAYGQTESYEERTYCVNEPVPTHPYVWPTFHLTCDDIDLRGDYGTAFYQLWGANAHGCDSTVVLHLTILHMTTDTITESVCDSYTWTDKNKTYYESTLDTCKRTNAVGCDSVIALNLTIRYSSDGTDEITACDSLKWTAGNNVVYYESTFEPTWTLENANSENCDSTVTLNLTILKSTTGEEYRNVCDTFKWELNGVTYHESVMIDSVLTGANAVGCDSTAILNLTIRYSSEGIDEQKHCLSYEWPYSTNDTVYTVSTNEPSVILYSANAQHCDSTVTLNLTINYNDTVTDDTIYICENTSHTWNGEVFDTAGTYHHVFTNVDGCDSIVTFTLIVNDTNHVYVYDTCGYKDLPWTYNDRTYDYKVEDDIFELENRYECDSIVHYYLQPIWKCSEFLQFPSVITPNGDGLNDRFVVVSLVEEECYPKNKLSIYNRWGYLLYERENIKLDEEFWDPGDVPAGTYFFRFDGYGFDEKVERRGSFEIIR